MTEDDLMTLQQMTGEALDALERAALLLAESSPGPGQAPRSWSGRRARWRDELQRVRAMREDLPPGLLNGW